MHFPHAAAALALLLVLACLEKNGAAAQSCDFYEAFQCREEQGARGSLSDACLDYDSDCSCDEVAIINACDLKYDCHSDFETQLCLQDRPECEVEACDGTFDLDSVKFPSAKGAVHLNDGIALILLSVVVGLVAASMIGFALFKGDVGLPALILSVTSGFCGFIFLVLGVIPRKVPVEQYFEDGVRPFDLGSGDDTPLGQRVYMFSGPTLGPGAALILVSVICFIVFSAHKKLGANGNRV